MTKLCPYCHVEALRLFSTGDRNKSITKKLFSYYRCSKCELIFLGQVPEDLGRYYTKEYYHVPGSLAALEIAAEHERFKLDLITRFIRKGALLEVGPAFGNFAYLAKKAGFDVEVIEMDTRCCEFIRDVAGITTMQNDNAIQAVQGRGPYDVVALWHVIEHLSNFQQTLNALAEKVRLGGFLVVAAPNPEATQFTVLGRYWTHVDAPRHVVLIPVSLLVSHMQSLGFSVVAKTMTDPGGLGWNAFGWQVSLSNFVHSRLLKIVFARVGKAFTLIMRKFERNDQTGSAYTLIFRKDI